jgi:NTP pyrophosphatase (non-canonical NTP hydrolase)
MEAHRKDRRSEKEFKFLSGKMVTVDKLDNKDFLINIKDTFEDEIADVFIRLFDLCGYMDIDIEKHIQAKMQYNKTRPYKHDKKY